MQEVAAKDASTEAAGANSKGGGAGGMFRALIDTIIGNLELHITNVHVRYEDTTSNPGHSFCIGVMLQEISGHTANADWQRAFVSSDALKMLRKVTEHPFLGLGLSSVQSSAVLGSGVLELSTMSDVRASIVTCVQGLTAVPLSASHHALLSNCCCAECKATVSSHLL